MCVCINIDILRQFLPALGGTLPSHVNNNNSMGATLLAAATPETFDRVMPVLQNHEITQLKRAEITRRLEIPMKNFTETTTQTSKLKMILHRRAFFDAKYVLSCHNILHIF